MRKWRAAILAVAIVAMQGCMGSGGGETAGEKENAAPSASSTASAAASATTAEASGIAVAVPEGLRIQVDQAGYLPDMPKLAVVAADAAFSGLPVQLLRQADGKTVWEGVVGASKEDANSGDWTATADFGDTKETGTFVLRIGDVESPPFRIAEDAFAEALRVVARSYRLQRANFAIEDESLGLSLPAGHAQDAHALVYFKDEKGRQPQLDVSGGWYDAGDYGKYVPTATVTAAQLMLAYELRVDTASKLTFLTERERSAWAVQTGAPDLLDEIKYELDWLLKMQRADGAVYHKVGQPSFPGYISPAEDISDRYVYGLSTFGTAQFAGTMAMAARVYKPLDAAYADRMLQSAVKAWRWVEAQGGFMFRRDEGQDSGSGPYDKNDDREERFWALAELYRTTGDPAYARSISESFADLSGKDIGSVSWGNAGLLGQWALAVAATGTDSPDVLAAAEAISRAAEAIAGRVGEDGYRSSLTAAQYTWGSNKNALAQGEILLLAAELQPQAAWTAAAADQLHYVLGRNALGRSYVTGIGSLYPHRPHHRISLSAGVLVPGLLVGGPNGDRNDPVLEPQMPADTPPAKSYLDDVESYASNEYAIDYNAPLLFDLLLLSPRS